MTNKLKHRQDFEITIDDVKYQLTCYYQNTRTGFRHLCFLTSMCEDGEPNTKDYVAKRVYYNRTWEEYTYQSVLRDALETLYQKRMIYQAHLAMDTVRRVD